MDPYYKGVIFALFSAAGFGMTPVLAVFAYDGGVSVYSLLFLRFMMAAVVLFSYIFINKNEINLNIYDHLKLFVQGGIIYSVFSICYFSAISVISPSLAVLLFYTYPIIVALLSFLVNGEKITKKIVFSIIVSFAGLIMLFGENFNNLNKIGILLALGASISYSIYAIYGRYILDTIPLSVTTAYICFFAAFTFLAAGLYQNKLEFSFTPVSWIYVGLITLITVGGFLSFFAGIKLTSPTIVSILGMTEPIMTIILSFIIFSEQFSLIQIMGVGLVLTASTQVLFKKQKKIIKNY